MVETMEVQKGFKKTDVGVIPTDWDIRSLKEISDIDSDTLNSSTNPDYYFKYISIEDIDNGILRNYAELKFKNAPSRARRKIRKDDVLLSTVRPNLKSHLLIIEEVKDWICSTGFAVIRPKADIADGCFIFNHLFSSIISKQIDNLISGSNYPAINSKDVRSLQIPLPPTKAEQTAIATALNDADALITQLEKLIAKKKAIKQGAMQELLTGKKRINSYSEAWITRSLPNVCWFQEGPGLRNWQFTKSGIKVINVTNLEDGYLNLDRTDRYISLDEFNRMYKHFEIDEYDIVVASSGNSYGKVAVVRRQNLPLLMNTSVIRFKPLKIINYNFLLAFLKSYLFKEQIDLLITGGAQPNFGPAHLKKIIINMPQDIEEQKNISEILNNMDLEIAALEKKLDKYKMLKQGMMQNFLTGRIRLV